MFWKSPLDNLSLGECKMPGFAELRKMYDQGQTEAVLAEIEKNPAAAEETDDVTTLKGWCHYRRKEFDQAHTCATAADSHQWARELMAYLCAYVPKYKNDDLLKQIADELGSSNINVANALIIRARAEDCSLLDEMQVFNLTGQFAADKTVHGANLFHNAGRWYLIKNCNREARNSLAAAIIRYERIDINANFHHRAAAKFWLSQAAEKMHNMSETITAMQESVNLWDQQVRLDPTNKGFQQSSENAKKRLGELLARQQS